MSGRAVILGTVIGLVIIAIILTAITWEIELLENYYAREPYQYEQTLLSEKQVRDLPRFWKEVTQGKYLVKNLEDKDGIFTLIFLFDNGTITETRTMKVEISPDEEKVITINSPLAGVSTITLNVVPPNKAVLQQRILKKTVNIWYYLPGFDFLFK